MNEICSSSTRRGSRKAAMFDGTLVSVAAREAFAMLNPRRMAANPVMFVTEIGAILIAEGCRTKYWMDTTEGV